MSSPAYSSLYPTDAFEVTPSDTATNAYTRLYVGGVGDVTVVTEGGQTVLYKAVPAGSWIDVRTSRVLDTGTDATFIVGHR